jgi:hypothetical protein
MSINLFSASLLFRSALLLCIVVAGSDLSAQAPRSLDFVDIRPKQNSPLSRFGLGDQLDQVHAAAAGMGALQTTFQDPFHLNILNPASLANLQATSFEVGLYARNGRLEDGTGSANTWQGNLNYLALGFPLRNPINLNLDRQLNSWNGGMAFSLAPTTLVGYDLELIDDADPETITNNQLRGNGGTYRFSWSTALRYKGLSGGVNVNYNFGKITNSRILVLDSIPQALGSEFLEEYSISGFSLGYGVQYAINLKQNDGGGARVPSGKRIILAANGVLGTDVDTDASLLFRRFSPNLDLGVRDTLAFTEGEMGRARLPASYSFGVAYDDFNRLFVGVEYGRTAFSDYFNDAQPGTLEDISRMALGIQFIPDYDSYNDYWKRVRYRLGARLEDDPRQIDGAQARRNAVTVGAGFPIRSARGQISFIDLAVEYGKFGIPDVIDETYVQFTLGFALNDNSWFYKRKLN